MDGQEYRHPLAICIVEVSPRTFRILILSRTQSEKTKLTQLEFGLTFHHIRHKTAFDNEPYAAWNVKKSGLDGQEYRHPLVIRIVEVSPRTSL